MLAAAEGTRPDALKGRVHLGQDVFLLPNQVERHFLFKLTAAKVPQVKRHVRKAATGFTSRWDQSLFLQLRHVPAKPIGQGCEAPAISVYFSCCHGTPEWFDDWRPLRMDTREEDISKRRALTQDGQLSVRGQPTALSFPSHSFKPLSQARALVGAASPGLVR
jgi:hypothetical protein